MNRSRVNVARVAKALGASRVVRLKSVEHTPLGLLSLTDRVRRLRSTGPGGSGRPSDPRWSLGRIIKFEPKVWKTLAQVAAREARLTGRKVSPAQVASILIEGALHGFKPRRRKAQ